MAKKKKADKASKSKKAVEMDVEMDEAIIHDEDEGDDYEAPKKKKKSSSSEGSVYKIIEVVGSSAKSWEHAAEVAIERASQTLEDLRVAQVVDQDLKIEDGAIAAYRTKLRLSFKFRD